MKLPKFPSFALKIYAISLELLVEGKKEYEKEKRRILVNPWKILLEVMPKNNCYRAMH